jgi:hypothetical protein
MSIKIAMGPIRPHGFSYNHAMVPREDPIPSG